MEKFNLSVDELQELHAARLSAKRNKDVNAAYKIHAVILLGSGMTKDEVSEVLFIHIDTLGSYLKKYINGGLKKLIDTGYLGRSCKLSASQLELLENELESKIYLTTKAICYFVKEKFNIDYTISGITRILHRLNYVYKKPKLIPKLTDDTSKEIFLNQFLSFMSSKKHDEAVFFLDAVHAVHNSMPSYGWIKKGKTETLESNTGRKRLNIHGAMNAETYETTIVSSEESINTDSTIKLLSYLQKIYSQAKTIYIILDNARYHFSAPVQEFIKDSNIKLIFLPPYSPELNLIERLWRIFKKNILHNRFYSSYTCFKNACINFFVKQKNYQEQIHSIMGDGLLSLV